jgi:NADH:ubiquinone oxidoreductase subunit 3 (subunit A)
MTDAYLINWVYIGLFIAAGGALVVLILLFSKLVNPEHLTPEKLASYECGIPPVGRPWSPFAVRYFVFGLLFLVFDVEAVFLFPWTLVFRGLGTAGFVEMVIFVAVLGFGLVYAWRKGALEWA